jgi:hypothetical protein
VARPLVQILGCPVLRILKGGVFSPAPDVACQFKSPALKERQGRGTPTSTAKAGPPVHRKNAKGWATRLQESKTEAGLPAQRACILVNIEREAV